MKSVRAFGLAGIVLPGLVLAGATSSVAAQSAPAQPTAAQAAAADAPMATSSGSPQVADQIQAFVDSSPAAARGRDLEDDLPLPDRKVHGEVSLGVGNHGYRSAYARSDFPVGKTGTVSIAVGEERGRGYGYGYPYGGYGGRGSRQTLGLGFDWSGARREQAACRTGDATVADRRRCEAKAADPAD